jgi:hypothetical protein
MPGGAFVHGFAPRCFCLAAAAQQLGQNPSLEGDGDDLCRRPRSASGLAPARERRIDPDQSRTTTEGHRDRQLHPDLRFLCVKPLPGLAQHDERKVK